MDSQGQPMPTTDPMEPEQKKSGLLGLGTGWGLGGKRSRRKSKRSRKSKKTRRYRR